MTLEFLDTNLLYRRDSNLTKRDVQIVQEWLKKQPHLPQLEEMQVLIFLHSCYYKIEDAKTTIDNYFTVRTLCPHIFDRLKEEDLKTTLSTSFIGVLPERTPEQYVIFASKLLTGKAESFNCTNYITAINMVSTLHYHQNGFEDGVIVLFDMKGFTLAHLTRLNLVVIKHALYHLQEAAPVRIKQIHVVNVIPLTDRLIGLLKPFLSNDLYNLLKLHSTLDSLFKYIPKECLPEDFGGSLPLCSQMKEDYEKNILNNYEFFDWHDSQKVDESKRLEKSKAKNELFGLEGTFKKLEID